MSSIQTTILKIHRELISTFASLDSWFDREEKFLFEKPDERWSAAEILEHVMLTNQYLLILIDKGTRRAKSLAKEKDLNAELSNYDFENSALRDVGVYKSFPWEHPGHMEPKGTKPLDEVRKELRDQLHQCLCILDSICSGEGVLYRITMTVNNLGKLDVYQYIYFLVLHIKRHITQLEKREMKLAR